MKTKNCLVAVIVAALSCVAVLVCSAQEPAAPKSATDNIFVPEQFGTVEEVFKGSGDRMVIHIQDAHTDPVAQRNISAILDRLLANYDVDAVWVEGASGVIDTALISSFPGARTKDAVAGSFIDAARMSGAEHFSITSGRLIGLFGAEDQKLYDENVDAFKTSWKKRDAVMAALDGMRTSLDALKDKAYPEALKEVDAKKVAFEKGQIPFSEYCTFLKSMCQANGVDTAPFGAFNALLDMFAAEKGIDFAGIDKERLTLIDELAARVNRKKLTELTQEALTYRLGRMAPIAFYRFLIAMAGEQKVDMSRFANLGAYVSYLEMSQKVDRALANRDREKVENALLDKLCSTAESKEVSALSRDFRVMEKLLTLKISRNDLDFYLKNRDACSPEKVSGAIKESLLKNSLEGVAGDADTTLPAVEDANAFYEIALKRDSELVNNLIGGMRKLNKDRAVLVCGGFHSDGVKRALREKGISYVVILPKVGGAFDDKRYASLLIGDETPYLDFIKKQKSPDALPGSIGMAATEEKAEAALAPRPMTENDEIKGALELAATAVNSNELTPAEIASKWPEDCLKLIDEIKKMIAPAGMDYKALSYGDMPVEVLQPVTVSADEIYVPVKVSGRIAVLKYFKAAVANDIPAAMRIGAEGSIEGFTVQAAEIAGAITSLAARGMTQAISQMVGELPLETTAASFAAMLADLARQEQSSFGDDFAGKNVDKTKVIAYDLGEYLTYDPATKKYDYSYNTMVGLVNEMREMKQKDPNIKFVFITRGLEEEEKSGGVRDYIKRLKAAAGFKDEDFDMTPIETSVGETDLRDKVVTAIERKFGVDGTKDVVIVAANPERYGQLVDNRIKGTPVLKPNISAAQDEVVSVRKILLFAKIILANDGNIDNLVAAIDRGEYPGLKAFLDLAKKDGVIAEVDAKNIAELMHNPSPVKVPTTGALGAQIKGYMEFLKAA